jgi:uncharacterized membrane protein
MWVVRNDYLSLSKLKIMELFVLKIYYYDCSSFKLLDVSVKVCSSLELCKLYWKKFIYEIYLDNDEEFIEFENFDVDKVDYENYSYMIVLEELIN